MLFPWMWLSVYYQKAASMVKEKGEPVNVNTDSPLFTSVRTLRCHAHCARRIRGSEATVEQVENNLLVAVQRHVQHNFARGLALRVGRADGNLFGSVAAVAETDGNLLPLRHVAQIQDDFRSAGRSGGIGAGCGRSGYRRRRDCCVLVVHLRKNKGLMQSKKSLLCTRQVSGLQRSADVLEVLFARRGGVGAAIRERTRLPRVWRS